MVYRIYELSCNVFGVPREEKGIEGEREKKKKATKTQQQLFLAKPKLIEQADLTWHWIRAAVVGMFHTDDHLRFDTKCMLRV